ncbi:MAG TPA: tetratricopeptide repeat protein [Leptospiraceae bacterium]|nr:tetratricopeptide repeat protein [Leptospiraceae bacterium]
MRRWIPAFVLILLLILSFGASRSILKARLLELRIAIQRDQILRYELSSRLLRYRFQQMLEDRDNIRSEIKLTVLESHVVNDLSQEASEPGWMERGGAILINGVRLLSAKPRLDILEKRIKVLQLHAGFYHERNRNCPGALARYQEFELSEDSPDTAFVMLHSGYCQAVTGKIPDAIATLERVEGKFPGTHFERSAKEILLLLRGMQKKAESIRGKSDEEAASTLFESGQFWQVDQLLDKKIVSGRQKYMLARSKEEIGQTAAAVRIYRELTSESDPELSKLANRRMLLMGTVYNQGESIAKEARQNAQRTGDTAIVQEINQAVVAQKPAELLKVSAKEAPEVKFVSEIKTEIEKREALIEATPAREEPPPGISVVLSDGRTLQGFSILMEDDRAILAGSRPVAVPAILIASIRLAPSRTDYNVCAIDRSRHVLCGEAIEGKNQEFAVGGDSMPLTSIEAILVQKRGVQ